MRYAIAMMQTGLILLAGCTAATTRSSGGASTGTGTPGRTATPAEIEEVLSESPPLELASSGGVTESFDNGEVDWSDNRVRATGTGVLDPDNPNRAQARLMAERAAVVVAQRNLLEIVQGVRVDSETRVENFMTDYDVIYTRVEGVVRDARQIGPAVYDSAAGTVEVELEMEIYDSGGLSGAIGAALDSPAAGDLAISEQTREFLQQYSGLVLDGTDAGLKPSMYPKIYDSDGNLLIDTSQYASYLGAGEGTALQFISDLDRVLSQTGLSDSPLVLNVRGAAGQLGTDIVLGEEESGALGWLSSGLPLLMSAGKLLLGVL
ncbi:MAG: hypothetical protein R6U36_05615 [Candidatus Fermentibacteraceae bacterium]